MAAALTHPDYPISIGLDGDLVSLQGAVSTESSSAGKELRPWRIPFDDRELFSLGGPLNFLPMMARSSSGVRLSMTGSLQRLRLVVRPFDFPVPPGSVVDTRAVYDLVVNGQVLATRTIRHPNEGLQDKGPFAEDELLAAGGGPKSYEVTFDGLSTGPNDLVEVWLPHNTRVTVLAIAAGQGAVLRQLKDNRPRWIVHGSSITHCMEAASPARTWPATVARLANLNLLSLGFGGQCHMEQAVARIISSTPADAITLKLGINVHNLQSLSRRRPGLKKSMFAVESLDAS